MTAPYFERDGITIYNADALDILPTLSVVDLVLTDPPYGVTYQSNKVSGRGANPITNDGARLSLWLYRKAIPLIQARHWLWFTRWDAWPDVWGILGQVVPIRGLLVWDKGHPGMGDLHHWGPSYELIASAGYGNIIPPRDGSILKFQGVPPGNRRHPTEKPVPLLRYLISKLNARSVLDPFMGSGATLEAALVEGRRAIGIEIEERYAEIAAKRLAQMTLPLEVLA